MHSLKHQFKHSPRFHSPVGNITHNCKPWSQFLAGGPPHMHGLWEQRLNSMFCDLYRRGHLRANTNAGHNNGSYFYFDILFIARKYVPECFGWSVCILNIICSQIIPCMALGGICEICNFMLLIAAAWCRFVALFKVLGFQFQYAQDKRLTPAASNWKHFSGSCSV